jgi:hypothetical protein
VNGGGVELIGDLHGHEGRRRWSSQGSFFGRVRGSAFGWGQAVGSSSGSRSRYGVDARD